MYDSTLASSFNFTPDDLKANQQGQLSAVQHQRYTAMNAGCVRWSLLATLGLLIGTGVMFLVAPQSIIVMGILTLVSLGGVWLAWSTRNDIFSVFTIAGEACLRIDRGEKGSRHHIMSVRGYEFTLDPSQYELIEDGTTYVVHYGTLEKDPEKQKTASKQVLSVERA